MSALPHLLSSLKSKEKHNYLPLLKEVIIIETVIRIEMKMTIILYIYIYIYIYIMDKPGYMTRKMMNTEND